MSVDSPAAIFFIQKSSSIQSCSSNLSPPAKIGSKLSLSMAFYCGKLYCYCRCHVGVINNHHHYRRRIIESNYHERREM